MPAHKEKRTTPDVEAGVEESTPHSKPAHRNSIHPGVHALKYELQDLETKIAAGTPITSKDLVPLHMVQKTLEDCKE